MRPLNGSRPISLQPTIRTKYLAQQAIDAAAKEGFHVVSVMPSGIFGPGDPHFGKVVQLFLKGGAQGLGWSRSGHRGLCIVDDLVEAMILAVERSQARRSLHHLNGRTHDPRNVSGFQRRGREIAVPTEIPRAVCALSRQHFRSHWPDHWLAASTESRARSLPL